jgi:hypothetical protein
MAVELEIQDGIPHWYLSPNIWTVPGDNPEGPPGQPVVGDPCFMWAKVRNNGSTFVNNAKVRFYWANPAVGFDRNTANFIGSSNVSLAASETRDVLCLTPWIPVYVNEGHECILAEVFHPIADPLPASSVFNVPTDRHVAQRNLQIVKALKSMEMMFSVNFSICNSSRNDRVFRIYSKPGHLEELKLLEKQFIPIKIPFQAKGTIEHAGFVTRPCPDQQTIMTAKPIVERFPVKGNVCSGLSFVGKLRGDAALIHILQEINGKIIGGLGVLILSEEIYQLRRGK